MHTSLDLTGVLESGWWYPQDSKRPGGPVITWEPIRGPSPDKRMNGAKVIPDGFDFPWLDSKTAAGQTDHSPLIMHNRAFSPDCTCALHPPLQTFGALAICRVWLACESASGLSQTRTLATSRV